MSCNNGKLVACKLIQEWKMKTDEYLGGRVSIVVLAEETVFKHDIHQSKYEHDMIRMRCFNWKGLNSVVELKM